MGEGGSYLWAPASYTFHSTGETRPITHHITCNSKNLIYMIKCRSCHKQYIGETKRLKDRFNEHRRPVDEPTNIFKPTTVSEHFLTIITPLMTSQSFH